MTVSAAADLMPNLVLEDHLLLLGEVEQVIREENGLIRATGQPPDAGFIRRKARLAPRLDVSLALLRDQTPGRRALAEGGELLREAQRRLHRLLLLDRENEGLLLRSLLPQPASALRTS